FPRSRLQRSNGITGKCQTAEKGTGAEQVTGMEPQVTADEKTSKMKHRTLAIRSAASTAAMGMAVAVFLCPGMGLGQAPEGLHRVSDSPGRFAISVPSGGRGVQCRGGLRALSRLSPDAPEAPPDSVEGYVRDMSAPLAPKECARQVAFAMRMSIGRWTTLSEGSDTLGGLPAYSRTYVWH